MMAQNQQHVMAIMGVDYSSFKIQMDNTTFTMSSGNKSSRAASHENQLNGRQRVKVGEAIRPFGQGIYGRVLRVIHRAFDQGCVCA
ncbi:hypothetical protein ACLOJK_038318 [Asimina triloba]